MSNLQKLRDAGQSPWLDNITRDMLNSRDLERSIQEYSLTGLTSNPTIFEHAIASSTAYDQDITRYAERDLSAEEVFFNLALEDIGHAADLFLDIHQATNGMDGFVSLEVSPLLARDTQGTIAAARGLHERSGKKNLYIKIPGTAEGLPAIEESIFAGIPINVTLLFSADQYLAAANAWLRGIERRIEAGLSPSVSSVASVFISRWDVAVASAVPTSLKNRLGIAIAQKTYRAYREFLNSDRVLRAQNFGAVPQRLLWASTGTKDPKAPDTLYAQALIAPYTINTLPEKTLKAFNDHGRITACMDASGGESERVLAEFAAAGTNIAQLAQQLQDEGAASFVASWNSLIKRIEEKASILKEVR